MCLIGLIRDGSLLPGIRSAVTKVTKAVGLVAGRESVAAGREHHLAVIRTR
jgi:hypothetical protein